jgi:fibronectin type 3 domain-containing protein
LSILPRSPWIALFLALAMGCATSFDLDRARRTLSDGRRTSLPELIEGSPAALPTPEGVSAMSGELRTVPLRWDPVISGDVGGYIVERALAAEGPFTRVAVLAGRNTTLWVDSWREGERAGTAAALGDGVTAFYRVRCIAGSGQIGADASGLVSAITAAPPEPPSGLRAYSHQPRQVPLSWRASEDPNVTAYRVYRSPSFRGSFEPLATVQGRFQTIYTDAGLGNLRVFYYRIAALNRADGEGSLSEPVRAVTKPEPLPPLGLRATARRLGVNELGWEPNVETDLVGYRLFRQRAGSDARELVAALPADQTTAEDEAVAADEELAYLLVAVDKDGLASDPAMPVAVASVGYAVSATARADGVHLAWNPRTDEGYHGARIFSHGLLSRSELAFVTTASFVDTNAKPGGRYRYTVVLERADATLAPPSSPVEIRVPER